MQTFLPCPQFTRCAEVLDNKRLGKQRVECLQILNAIERGGAWSNHPAVLMWVGYTDALKRYSDVIIREWIRRGFNNNMAIYNPTTNQLPPWLGDDRVHLSHRRNLIRKLPEHYGQWWPTLEPQEGYYWPVTKA